MKAAVVGCGRMGVFTSDLMRRHAPACWFPLSHAEAVVAHPALDLAALCDRDPATLARASAAHPSAPIYVDHADLLEDFVPDLLGLATRTAVRTDIIADFVVAGTRAMHVEKPLCNSMAQLERLDVLFARPDQFATYGAIRRYLPIYRQALALAESGRIGTLRELRVTMGLAQLFWTHPHSVDLLLFAAGKRTPVAVEARLDTVEMGNGARVIANDPAILAATIWFDDDVAGHISRGEGHDLHIHGSRGTVSVLRDGSAIMIEEYVGDSAYPEIAGRLGDPVDADAAGGTLAPIGELVDCLTGDNAAITCNAKIKRDILLGQRALFAMVQSHLDGGRRTDLAAIAPDMVVEARTGALFA